MRRVLIIGASGHIGSAAWEALDDERHELIAAGRSSSPAIDVTEPSSITALFDAVGEVDAVVCAVGVVPFRPVTELTRADYEAAFRGKVLSQLDVVRIGIDHVRDGGSFTLTTGILARSQMPHAAAAALANGALESFVLAAAPELPRGIRINAVSPTVLASSPEYFDGFPGRPPVADAFVGQAFKRSVDGVESGRVFELD